MAIILFHLVVFLLLIFKASDMRQKLFDSILKHAENEYPNEACGLIVDTGKTQKFIPCKNMSDNPKEHFLISPDEQLEAEKQGEILMIIHSHYTGRQWLLGYADCWALIMDYYQREFNITLKNYSVPREWWEDGKENIYDENWQAEGFIEVELTDMNVGDIIMMKLNSNVTNHAALYVGDNLILHHGYGQLSSRTPYGKYFRDRTVRIVRHKERFNVK